MIQGTNTKIISGISECSKRILGLSSYDVIKYLLIDKLKNYCKMTLDMNTKTKSSSIAFCLEGNHGRHLSIFLKSEKRWLIRYDRY